MTELLQFDEYLFHLINGEWHHPWLDALLPYWRNKKFWIPFYVLLTGFVVWKFRIKAIYFLLAVALTVTLADTISSKVVKKTVQRVRPCNDIEMQDEVNLLVGCGKAYSFTSSHASNHFAVATFLSMTLGLLYPWAGWVLMFWAASIAYAQVYVGVHYPLDVVGGAIIGLLVGCLVAKVYLRLHQLKFSA